LVWFPTAPKDMKCGGLLKDRFPKVLSNGHSWAGEESFRPYEFRNWLTRQKYVTPIPHWVANRKTPTGSDYQRFLSGFAGATACCDTQVVPKYFEIPLAGCVSFAQHHPELDELGFKDGENIIYINKETAECRIMDFLDDPEDFQTIADNGRKLVSENYTAKHFADKIYEHSTRI